MWNPATAREGVIAPAGTPMPSIEPIGRLEPLSVPLGRMGSILRRHAWIVLLAPLLGVGGTGLLLKRMPKQFTAEALIVIEPQRTQVSDLQAISPDSSDAGSLVRTQIDILRSPALTRHVVQSLNLTANPEFAPHGVSMAARLRTLVGPALLAQFGLPAPPPAEMPDAEDRVQIAAAILDTKISFANEPRSSVLRIVVTTQNPKVSADIANKFAKEFLDFKRQEKFIAMQRAHDWFKEQMGSLSEQLRADELGVEEFRQQHRLDEQPPDEATASHTPTINRQQLDASTVQLVQVSRERALKEGELAQAEAATRGGSLAATLPEVLASPVISQLLAQTATAAGKEAELASKQGPGNPQLVAARAQLHRLQLRTEAEMGNVAKSLSASVQASREQEQALRDQMERFRVAVGNENLAQVALGVLQTKARATRSIYESFLSRATQLANVAGIQEPDASLVSSAHPPLGPSGPQVGRLMMVAGILTTALGIGLAVLIERLRRGFSMPEQLEASLELPLMGMMPAVPRRALRNSPGGRAAMQFTAALDNLRGQMRAMGEARPKLVMITSALPREGKSVFAAGLARNAAAAGWRVMLIECDFYSPVLAKQFGIGPGPGLCQILSGDLLGDLGSVVHAPAPGLHVITAGRANRDTQELLASRTMGALLAAMRDKYDLVLLDTPPVLPVADALVLARQVDATVMVVRWEKTARVAVQDAARRLRESRAQFVGAVMTRINPRAAAGSGGRMSNAFGHYSAYHFARANRF